MHASLNPERFLGRNAPMSLKVTACRLVSMKMSLMLFFKNCVDGDKLGQDNFISGCITIQSVQRLRKVGESRVRNGRQFTSKFQV